MKAEIKWVLGAVAVGTVAVLALHAAGTFTTVVSAPGRVVNKTLGTDNIINSYEWFYDTHAQFISRRSQIRAHAEMKEEDPKERARLNIELSAMRQSCRDLATRYNANSQKANKSIFKSNGLPETLVLSECDA